MYIYHFSLFVFITKYENIHKSGDKQIYKLIFNIWKSQAFNLGYKLMHKSEQKFITNIDYLLSPKSILNKRNVEKFSFL